MREIKAMIRTDRLSAVLRALHAMPGLPGVTASTIRGFGKRYPADGPEPAYDEVAMTKIELVVPAADADAAVAAIERAAHTGRGGDGKIFVIPVEHAVKIRTGERDLSAL